MIAPFEESIETLLPRALAATEQGHVDDAIELYRKILEHSRIIRSRATTSAAC